MKNLKKLLVIVLLISCLIPGCVRKTDFIAGSTAPLLITGQTWTGKIRVAAYDSEQKKLIKVDPVSPKYLKGRLIIVFNMEEFIRQQRKYGDK